MRVFRDRRTSILATVTGISVGIAGVLLFVRFGSAPDPTSLPEPTEAAHGTPLSASPRRPGMPTLPPVLEWPGNSAGPSGRPGASGASGASDVPHANAPTENLRRLATALRLKHKSITGVLTVAAGLNLTAPVEISMLWDEGGSRPTRATRDYINGTGNRFIFAFPAGDGSRRAVANVVTLAERAADGEVVATYAVRANVSIVPLYDVTVSALELKMLTDCDFAGASEVGVRVRYPDDKTDLYKLNTYEGNVHTFTAFARAYQEVGQASNYVKPTVDFYEHDPAQFNSPIAPPGNPLLPGADYTFDRLTVATNDQYCQAGIKYSVTYRLREYLYLE
jgi:hypothetical protein